MGDDVDAVGEGNLRDLGTENGGAGEFPIGGDDAAVFEEVCVEEGWGVVFGCEGDRQFLDGYFRCHGCL